MKFRGIMLFLGALVIVVGSTTGAFAQIYERGHEALQLWDKQAMESVPPLLKYWLYVMMGTFALGLLFVWRHPIARWLVGGFLMTMVVAGFSPFSLWSGLITLVILISFFFDIRDAAIYLDHVSGTGMLS